MKFKSYLSLIPHLLIFMAGDDEGDEASAGEKNSSLIEIH